MEDPSLTEGSARPSNSVQNEQDPANLAVADRAASPSHSQPDAASIPSPSAINSSLPANGTHPTNATSQSTAPSLAPTQPVTISENTPSIKSEVADDIPLIKTATGEVTAVKPSPSPVQTREDAQSHTSTPQPPAPDSDAGPSKDMPSSNEDSADAPTYGTRSRNRTAGARPNYAEDQDMDFEYTAPSKSDTKRTAATAETKQTTGFRAVNSGNPGNAVPASDADAQSMATGLSKKRKAPSSSNAAPAQSAATSTATVRKATLNATSARRTDLSNMMFFTKTSAKLNRQGQLVADDGTVFSVNDQAYLVCEPPGEPYYLCRIMEFMHAGGETSNPVDCLRVNWFYRSRDVQRYNQDFRMVYATMHSDICPLTSLRGKCTITHRAEIKDLDQYRKNSDHFWWNQCFDRFIRRFYDVIPTSQVINVPEKVKKALDDRWKYIVVEAGRVKELTSAVKLCKRCSQYCASNDSVDCAMCGNSYHMNCVRPPLPKKPSRGFAWACGPCSRAQEKKLEARHTPQVGDQGEEIEEEFFEEEEGDPNLGDSTRAPSPDSSDEYADRNPPTEAELALSKQWQMRYLGIHCRVEDALQFDDRAIYPRASSRLGPRHQALVNDWYGRPVELVKPLDIKKKFVKTNSHKKDGKLSKETLALIEADRIERAKRPKHIMDEPMGYVARGEDFPNDDPRNTARVLWKMPSPDENHGQSINGRPIDPINDETVEAFIKRTRLLHKDLKVSEFSINSMDKALSLLMDNDYDWDKAYAQLKLVDRGRDLKEPIFTHEDLRKFEDGVTKFGSEHRLIKQHMKTNLPIGSIIRFYYLWKKTNRGHQIWDNYGGRKSTKLQKQNMDAAAKLQQELADDADDSAYDSMKADRHKREFQCKFCSRRHSPIWRRAPGVAPGQMVPAEKNSKNTNRPLLALCNRCANLWRHYAIEWEDLDEVGRKIAQGGSKSYKRRIDEELLKEIQAESNGASREVSEPNEATPDYEPAKKKSKTGDVAVSKAKPVPPKAPTPPPPIVPDEPKLRTLPCFVCETIDSAGETPISCTHCKLTVHKHCYGISDQNIGSKWVCDQCTNDRTPLVSTDYACTLCTMDVSVRELWETPKGSHKKRTDREKEKERMEKELLDKARSDYITKQAELHRPDRPREALKKTDGNNWVHVLCAVWTPEIKFSDAKHLEKAEGYSSIPVARFEMSCKLCHASHRGACVSCMQCHATFHVSCAYEAGYNFGFDITPVKNSRKDQITTVTLGQETGYMTAAIWCKDHSVKTIVHPMTEVVDDEGKTALELFVENYKQADQTLTGTARKANLLSQSTRGQGNSALVAGGNRRVSTVGAANAAGARKGRLSVANGTGLEGGEGRDATANRANQDQLHKKCVTCGNEFSPKWWSVDTQHASRRHGLNGILNQPLGINGISPAHDTDRKDLFECHKCHHKATKPAGRVPLSPKPFDINLEWPPSLSEPPETQNRTQIWSDKPPFPKREGQHGSPTSLPRMGSWDFPRPAQQPYQPHYGHHPSQPPSSVPQQNGTAPYSRPGSFYDRHVLPPRSDPPASHGPQPPYQPPPYAQRATGSPFGYPSNASNASTPHLGPGTSPALSAVQPNGVGQPGTPKITPNDSRVNASNSPHINNLMNP